MADLTTEDERQTTAVEMTDDLWEELESKISQFNREKLIIDGYEVSIILAHLNKTELAYSVYVDGEINYKWTTDDSDSDIPEKLWWKRSKRVHSKESWKSIKKLYTKEELKEKGFREKIHYYSPYFKSFRTLKRTFKRNNENIKWLRTDS